MLVTGVAISRTNVGFTSGIIIQNSACFSVFDCTIINHTFEGITCFLSSNGFITDSKLANNANSGITLFGSTNIKVERNISTGSQVRGVWLRQGALNNTVRENEFSGTDFGIDVFLQCNNNSFINNSVNNTQGGVILNQSEYNTFFENRLQSNNAGSGFSIANNSNSNNLVRNSVTNGESGITISQSDNNSALQNEISANNQAAISLNQSSGNIIIENNCTDNNIGIELAGNNPSMDNLIKQNNFTDNTSYGIILSGNSNEHNNNCFAENILLRNGMGGINVMANSGINNSFVSNKAQQNGPMGLTNYINVFPNLIITFDMSLGDFTTTNTRPFLNLEVIP